MSIFQEIDTKDISAVRAEVLSIFEELFPGHDSAFARESFTWVEDCFAGRYDDYQAIDTRYHDLEHTLQVTLCYARLLQGYSSARTEPLLTPRMFELCLTAILLHDTGYLKKRDDREGTGAKYTLVHVSRSVEFAGRFLSEKGFSPGEIQTIQNMICCTGVTADLAAIPFESELEKKMGFALGTADLIGQMAAPDYIDKLPILYLEFAESNRYNRKTNGPGVFTSARDLRRNTPLFWQKYVLPKINGDFQKVYKFLSRPAPEGENTYLRRIESNMARLEAELETDASFP